MALDVKTIETRRTLVVDGINTEDNGRMSASNFPDDRPNSIQCNYVATAETASSRICQAYPPHSEPGNCYKCLVFLLICIHIGCWKLLSLVGIEKTLGNFLY